MSGLSIEDRLTRLEDCEAIRHMVALYGRGADEDNDPAVMRRIFEADAVFDSPQAGRFEGVEAIVHAMSTATRSIFTWTLHFMISPVIDIEDDGRSARCRWHLWEPMKMRQPDDSLAETWFGATYDTSLRKGDDGQWRIATLFLDVRLNAKAGDAWPGAIDRRFTRADDFDC